MVTNVAFGLHTITSYRQDFWLFETTHVNSSYASTLILNNTNQVSSLVVYTIECDGNTAGNIQ